MFLKHLRETFRMTPADWATYSITYFLVGTGMNQVGQWMQIARFNHWWQVITVYVIYMVPVSVLLRCLPWWKQYLYGLLPMGLLELGGYAMKTSFANPGNILDRVLGERNFSLAMTLFFAAYFPILNSLVALIRRAFVPASSGAGAAPPAMKRVCEPELLDSLPSDHPDAVRNRRDLRLINLFMRNGAWFERVLPPLMRPGERALELGAGVGELGLRLNMRGIPLDGLDLWPRPARWPRDREWHTADIKAFSSYDKYAVVIGNLIFHQFTDPELAVLGAKLRQSARVVVACEPSRRRMSQRMMAAFAPLFGANHVTLHDSHVSIAAGFVGEELPHALGMVAGAWNYSCRMTALGAFRMVAVRCT